MPYKEGGGEKMQPFNKANGEYIRNPKCEEDEKNLVFTKLFGLKTGNPIAFPIFGIHDKEYCELIIKYCLDTKDPLLEKSKLTNYILVFKAVNDKSKLFNSLGYNINNWKELEEQIINGTSFEKKSLIKYNNYCLLFNTETKIYNKIKNNYYFCTTSWSVESNFKVRFVTLIPEVYKNE